LKRCHVDTATCSHLILTPDAPPELILGSYPSNVDGRLD
jgi:hypothetical protein